jgi:Tol biopolymer transport system component
MMNADGSGRRPLRGDVLSPSGRKLAASGDTGTAGLVFVSSLSGKPIRKFTIHVPADGYGPVAWAPDERAVTVEVYAGRVMIFVADLRGGLRLVSHIRSRDDESAAWSPDGRRIAFITCRSRYPFDCHLALIGRDGSGRKVVVRRIGDANTYDVQPVWAPNGRSIAFAIRFGDTREKPATQHERAHEEQRYGIYVVKPGGTGLRRIAATPYMEMDSTDSPPLAWSPDSRRIAFVDTRGITIADIVDGSLRRLTALPRTLRTDNYVSWAPSTRVLFSHRESLYTVLPGRRPLRVLP